MERVNRTVRFPPHLLRCATVAATAADRSVNDYVCACLAAGIAHHAENDTFLAKAIEYISAQPPAEVDVSDRAMKAVTG